MYKKIASFFACLLLSFAMLWGILGTPELVQAQLGNDPLGLEYGRASGLADTDPRSNIARMINVVLSLLGMISLVLIVYAGFLWMTSAGSDEQVGKAKKILTASVIGLVIILSAYSISRFVVENVQQSTGAFGA